MEGAIRSLLEGGGAAGTVPTNGGDSSAFGKSATGGGRGAYTASPASYSGAAGGSGGGAHRGDSPGGSNSGGAGNAGGYTPVEGYAGGSPTSGLTYSGGGGGAGAAGTDNALTGGGGAGVANSITGSSVTYAVGGDVSGGAAGTANKGNGGSGAIELGGGSGGSGVVIIRIAEVSEPCLFDATGNGNNGTMYNANCVDFDGTDADVSYGDVAWLDGLSTVSVSSWFYLDADPPEAAGILVSKDNTLECTLKRSSSREYSMSINNNHRVFASAPIPALGEWIHMVMTWTNTNLTADVRKLYLNGELVDTDTGGNQGAATLANSAQHLGIGGRPSPLYNIDGKISDTKIFAKELSAANVKELYDDSKVIIPTKNDASGGFLSQTDLILWAPLTDGAGTIAYDGSGYGRDGTYTGTSFLSSQTGAPQLVEGYNRPMWFDDTDDYVAIGTTNPMQFIWSDNFSLSAWIYCDTVTGFKHIIGKTYGNYRFAQDGGTISFRLDTNIVLCAGSCLTAKKWHHVVATYETNSPSAGGTAKVYCDGSLLSTCANSSLDWTSTGGTFQIGNSPGESYYFGGIINECIAYDKTLSLAEVQALGNTDANGGPLPPDPMGLADSGNVVGYWRNDGDVTWKDRSSNSNDGTVSGSPDDLLFKQGINGSKNVNTGRDNQGFPLRCQNNGAIGFKDGSNDHVTIPTSMDFQVSTLLLWVKFTELGRYFISSTGASPGYYQWYVYADGKLQFEYSRTETGVAANSIQGTAGDVVVDTWYQLGVILDSGGPTGTMYKDGNLLVQSAWSTTGALTPTSIYAGPTSNSFGGQIANMQIYNRALTYAEIQQNYSSFKARFGK